MVCESSVSARSKRVIAALFLGLLISVVYTVVFGDNLSSILFMGDFPGFYSIGRIVLEGNASHLYDFEYLRETQNRFWPQLNQTFLVPMYPPVVGLVMAAAAWIPPVPLRLLLITFETLILMLSLRALVSDRRLQRFTLIFFSLPILISIVGVQNTTISIALLAAGRCLLQQRRRLLAGVAIGLLLYKPQVGAIVSAVMMFRGGSSFLVGVSFAAMGQYLVGYWVYGGEWLFLWLERMKSFSQLRWALDGYQMTSILSLPYLEGLLGGWRNVIEVGIFAIAMLMCMTYAFYRRKGAGAAIQDMDMLLVTFPVFAPQIMFYDLGIAIFWLFACAPLGGARSMRVAILTVLAVNACLLVREPEFSLVAIAAVIVALASQKLLAWRV